MDKETTKLAYVFKLYVNGMTHVAVGALENLKAACDEYLVGHEYDIEVIDIREKPERAEEARILATPTLIKHMPPPIRRIVGDLSERGQLLVALDLINRS